MEQESFVVGNGSVRDDDVSIIAQVGSPNLAKQTKGSHKRRMPLGVDACRQSEER